jgi:hypothetical protein|tara:strand:+ start:229 stop:480 length:252 start_codon:yes stop_codon:yes gene_type:complete
MKGYTMTKVKNRFEITPMSAAFNSSRSVSVKTPNHEVKKTKQVTKLYRFGRHKYLTHGEALERKERYEIAVSQLRDGEKLINY